MIFSSIKTAQLPGILNILKNIKDIEMQLFLICHIIGFFLNSKIASISVIKFLTICNKFT